MENRYEEQYLTSEQEYQNALESKILLYENFAKIIEDISNEDFRDIKELQDDLKLQLNDLGAELRSV